MTRLDYLKAAHTQGAEAKTNGYERISPYTKMVAEKYWYAGYDMIDFDKFNKFVRESRREIKSTLGYSRIGLNNVR